MSKKVLLIGFSSMDLVANTFKIPSPGTTVTDDGGVAYVPGGRAANTAIAVNRLGGECAFLTKLGRDAHGQRLFQYYKEMGISTSLIKVDGEYSTGMRIVLREYGENDRIISYPGANHRITNENVSEAFSYNPDAICIDLESPSDTVINSVKMANSAGIPVFIDAELGEADFPLEKLPKTEVFIASAEEAYKLTGIRPLGAENALRVCLLLCKRISTKYIVLNLGERGAFIYDGKYHSVVPAFPTSASDTGAGAASAFVAGLMLEYLSCGDVRFSARFASAASSLTLMKNGRTASSIPAREEVIALMEKYSAL
jgi:ribokinase